MLIFHPEVSKCPTSQLTDVQIGWTNEISFVCSRLNEQMSEEAGEHGYCWMKNIFATAFYILSAFIFYKFASTASAS